MRAVCGAPALLVLLGCAAAKSPALAGFSYNNRSYNSLIVGRHPHYGDGQPDGCLVESPFELTMHALFGDSVAGVVRNAQTKEPVFYATIKLFPLASSAPILVGPNAVGRFAFARTQPVQRVEISAIGYRTLLIDLSARRLF